MTFSDIRAHQTIKQKLIQTYVDQRVSHAMLFYGPDGSGKLQLAIAYAQLLNCEHPRTDLPLPDACGKCPSCVQFQNLAHPDLHFFFPTATSKSVDSKPSSRKYLHPWREFLLSRRQEITLPDWLRFIGSDNKTGAIYADDAQEINRILGYKSYESEFKVIILWMIEKINYQAAPKLLKILEEPPEKTVFILLSANPDAILPTILSRCLPVRIPPLPGKPREDEAWQSLFDEFRTWMRLCFSRNIPELIAFSGQIGKAGRERQRSLLQYGLATGAHTTAVNYRHSLSEASLADEQDFLNRFSPVMTAARLPEFYSLLNQAVFHVERNANGPILFLDLSLRLSRLMKQ